MPVDYQTEVTRLTEQALVQQQMIQRCERHRDVLIRGDRDVPEHVVFNLVQIWLRQSGDILQIEALREAMANVLARAHQGVCPECGQANGEA